MKAAQLTYLSVVRRPISSVVGVLCVAVAVAACSAMVAVLAGKTSRYENLRSEFDYLVGPKSSGLGLTLGAMGIEPPIRDVIPYALIRPILRQVGTPYHWVPLLAFARCGEFPVYGTDARYFERPEGGQGPRVVAGKGLPEVPALAVRTALGSAGPGLRETFSSPAHDQAVLGGEVARRAGLSVGSRITLDGVWTTEDGQSWQREVTVVGIVEHGPSALDGAVLVDLATGWEHYRWARERGLVRATQSDEAVTYLLLALEAEQAERLTGIIHVQSVAQLVDVGAELAFLGELTRGAKWAAAALCLAILLLVASVMGILAHMRFESLRPELGLLRALGYPRSAVVACLGFEVLALSVGGILLALLGETVGIGLLDLPHGLALLESPTPWPTGWNLAVWGGALAAGMAALALPMLRLYHWKAHDALKGL